MKINKLWNGLKQIANGDYVLEGDLISEETIEIDLDDRLVVHGNIISEKSIIVEKGLIAGEGIKAGWGIEAGCGIKAGWGIEAKTFIHSEKRIFAGISIYHTNNNCTKTIKCAELKKGEICFGDLIITRVEEPKEFKVVCVEDKKDEGFFTIGKIYTWKNNTLTNDDGFVYGEGGAGVDGADPEKWCLSEWYKFIKIIDEKEGK